MTPHEVAILSATEAGKILRDQIGKIQSEHVMNKRPFDYVTAIDRQCEALIIQNIKKYFPTHEILAEESGNSEHRDSYCWIIDPLDGTTNFIHGVPHCSVSIALAKDNDIILGVIYDPFRDELFYAEQGKGAFCNHKPIRVSSQKNENYCLVATGFPFKNKELLNQYWTALSEIFLKISGIRRTGSAALDLAYVACGRFDGFWELRLSPWDIAAGSIIILEAGGKITDFEEKSNHIWNGNVIATNAMIHDFILRIVQKTFPTNP
jgi:myo-inositol-1(or 4)-monophosphatase